jgi:hypothetical protein
MTFESDFSRNVVHGKGDRVGCSSPNHGRIARCRQASYLPYLGKRIPLLAERTPHRDECCRSRSRFFCMCQ